MTTPKNLEEGKPIQQMSFNLEATTDDKIKYVIKISIVEDKLALSTSYKKGLICKEYYSEYNLNKLSEKNPILSFKNINEYYLF